VNSVKPHVKHTASFGYTKTLIAGSMYNLETGVVEFLA
jgi:hypothetical protein